MHVGGTPRRPATQLLPNRAVLSKMNTVVRKKPRGDMTVKQQVPAEWGGERSQAFRLLVGPRIKEYYVSENVEVPRAVTPVKTKEREETERLLSKLKPSRLKTPYEPLNVTQDQIDACIMPSDLLVQVFPPERRPKTHLLNRQWNPTNIKRTFRPETPSSEAHSRADSMQTTSVGTTTITTARTGIDENQPTEILLDIADAVEDEIPQEEVRAPTQRSIRKQKTDPRIAKLRHKQAYKLRSYFYVLRCWARTRINARVKAEFVVEVYKTQVSRHIVNKWHLYVAMVLRLRKCRSRVETIKQNKFLRQTWKVMKRKARTVMAHAVAAAQFRKQREQKQTRILIRAFSKVAHGRHICRIETNRNYRYKSKGPFTPIIDHYSIKRDRNIRARHMNFVKKTPPILKAWLYIVNRSKSDRKKTHEVEELLRKNLFKEWFEAYRDHFHRRVMAEVRHSSLGFGLRSRTQEAESAEKVEKTVMVQLLRDKHVLNIKLAQFDRLSQNHAEAVLRRKSRQEEIQKITSEYFRKQEELQYIEYYKRAHESVSKVREIRMQLAEGWLYHMARAVRSYDNQIVASQFCMSFRTLAEPLIDRAVNYFSEKRTIQHLLGCAKRERQVLNTVAACTKLYHEFYGWALWRRFIRVVNAGRTHGIVEMIRRRTIVMQLFPYFDHVEILPVRPPRPLKEVEHMFRDLPLVSIQRKVARERIHHINVRMLLMRRRILRDFIRAYASYVQVQIAIREVVKQIRRKQNLRRMRIGFDAFKAVRSGKPFRTKPNMFEDETTANIVAWNRHFFRQYITQQKLLETLPFSQ